MIASCSVAILWLYYQETSKKDYCRVGEKGTIF
jgi:hypothetical protein